MFEGYASFFTEYHTIKVVKIQDWRPRAFCIVFLFLTAVIGVWLVIFVNHGYCEVHTLSLAEYKEATWWHKDDWEQKYGNSSRTASYCHNKSFDYYYDEEWQYMNNTCVWDNLTAAVQREIMKEETHKLHVKTSLGVSTIHGSQSTSAFIPYVEELSFTHHIKIIHKGKLENTKFQLEVQDSEGEFRDHTDKLDSANGTQITFRIDELLSMIGTGLDETNPNANTPQEIKDMPEEYRNLSASYRLTGIKIALTLETSNYKFLDSYFDQYEYITKVKLYSLQSVEVRHEDAEGWEFWNCGGYASLPTLAAQFYEATKEQDFYTCGIDVDLIVLDGSVCTTSFYAIFQSLLQLTVLFGIATFFVDALFQFFSSPFRIAKTTTDMNEWEDYRQNHSIIEKVDRDAFKRALARSGIDLSPDYILEMENVLNECESPKMGLQDSNDTNASSPSGWKFELHCSKDDKLMPPTVLKFPLN